MRICVGLFFIILPDFDPAYLAADSFRKFIYELDDTRVFVRSRYFLHVVLSRMDGNEGQELFVFCKKHVLYKVMSVVPEEIWVYYKFDLIADSFTVVVSFHEAEYEPEFPFQ